MVPTLSILFDVFLNSILVKYNPYNLPIPTIIVQHKVLLEVVFIFRELGWRLDTTGTLLGHYWDTTGILLGHYWDTFGAVQVQTNLKPLHHI